MSKPTLFFSHSSKDKDMVLAIKNKVMQYTSGTLEIFQSSDGESIPFGTNWIHKVEEGLKEAKVMFVFITEQSISSGWIYFEAGYAYSKDVHVIPVGIGVSVGDLKAPLNLLQGFNITSADSLNNFLTIINREFDYSFPGRFAEDDFNEIMALSSSVTSRSTPFDEIIGSAKYELPGVYFEKPGEKKTRDTKAMFDRIKRYLDEQKIDYALGKPRGYSVGESMAVKGIKVDYIPGSEADPEHGKISVSISPYNFDKSFHLYLQLVEKCMDEYGTWLWLRPNDNYEYKQSDEDCAALLLEVPEWFSLSKSQVGRFVCNRLDLDFKILDAHTKRGTDLVLAIHFKPSETKASDVVTLVSKLRELKLIYQSGGKENA
ncbi:MAG: toll/interleukin-1 receptor domain-containing protein [Oscillospiraceae bacterium]|nr:toll/interleukin-1 receptor domain-containing protein [Oscillospiraceae bacterium]